MSASAEPSERSALERAIEAAHGPTALIRSLNERREASGRHPIARTSVFSWLSTRVPAEYAPDVEALTGVRCEELRPDIDWSVLRATPTATEVA